MKGSRNFLALITFTFVLLLVPLVLSSAEDDGRPAEAIIEDDHPDEEDMFNMEPNGGENAPQEREGEAVEGESTEIIEKVAPKSSFWTAYNKQESYLIEISSLAFIIAYLTFWWVGAKKNETIVVAWHKLFLSVFAGKYKQLYKVQWENHATCNVFAKERLNSPYLYARLRMANRHNILSFLTDKSSERKTDNLTFLIALDRIDPFVVSVFKKFNRKQVLEKYEDVRRVSSSVIDVQRLSNDFVVVSDCPGAAKTVLNEEVVKTLNAYKHLFEFLRVSDLNSTYDESRKRVLEVRMRLPQPEEMEASMTLHKMVAYLIDSVCGVVLKPKELSAARSVRTAILEQEKREGVSDRQEASEQARLDRIDKENERISTLPVDERRKAEAKQREKERKKELSKRTVVMKS